MWHEDFPKSIAVNLDRKRMKIPFLSDEGDAFHNADGSFSPTEDERVNQANRDAADTANVVYNEDDDPEKDADLGEDDFQALMEQTGSADHDWSVISRGSGHKISRVREEFLRTTV